MNNSDHFQHLLSQYTVAAATELTTFSKNNGSKAIVRASSWFNNSGIATAFVSCHKDGDISTDAVEGILSVSIFEKSIHFSAEICHPDGSIILEVADEVIDSPDNAIEKYDQRIRLLSSVAKEVIVDYLKLQIELVQQPE